MRFSDNFRNLRLSRGLNQYQAAERLGTSQASITAWERGTRYPTRKMLQKIADEFHVPVSSLVNEGTDENLASIIADSLHANPKLGILFDRTKNLSDKDLDAVLAVVSAITKENYGDDE